MSKTDHVNITAYNGFEKTENLVGRMDDYRKDKITSAKSHVDFIKKLFPGRKINVVELGSGNSRTLFALERAGALKKGYGIEISRSRFEFAERWKKEWDFTKVVNIHADARDVRLKDIGPFDLCFCVDLAFQFFEPVQKGAALDILRDTYKNLTENGKVVIELDGLERVLARLVDGKARLWEEFPSPDPWRYSLWDCAYDGKNSFLNIKKTFIKRSGDGFFQNESMLCVYKKNDIEILLKRAGFGGVNFYSGWNSSPYKNDFFEYIAVGIK